MSTTMEFRPITLYVDHQTVDKSMKAYRRWAKEANAALKEANKLFDGLLTLEQKQRIIENGWNAVIDMKRENSQFPEADIKTLLSLEGKDGSVARAALLHVPERHKAVGFAIVNDEVVVSLETEKNLIEQVTVRTSSIKGNHALEFAKTMAAAFKTAEAKGWTNKGKAKLYADSLEILKYDYSEDGVMEVMPNPNFIKNLL